MKYVRILGTENVEMRISKFIFTTETNAFPFVETVGASSRKRRLNGNKTIQQNFGRLKYYFSLFLLIIV
jgi:hypothetical protein